MRRLFVPSVVLLVLSVVMMVASWFHFRVQPGGGRLFAAFSYGYVWLVIADANWQPNPANVIDIDLNVEFPLLPLPIRVSWLSGLILTVPAWYFVVGFAIVTSLSARPWLEARRKRRLNICPNCGYDLSGVQTVCPECGKPINTQRATP